MSDTPTTLSPAPEAPQDDGGGRGNGAERWKHVPVEPTIFMLQAGYLAWLRADKTQVYGEAIADHCYRAMLDKAPDPPKSVNAFESNKRLIDDLVAALGAAVAFIVREYHDPALEPQGEWLPPHARKIHAQLAAALSKAKAKPGEQK